MIDMIYEYAAWLFVYFIACTIFGAIMRDYWRKYEWPYDSEDPEWLERNRFIYSSAGFIIVCIGVLGLSLVCAVWLHRM